MSNQQVATVDMSNFGPLAPSMQAIAAALPAQSEFSTGVTGGFGVVSIRGKVWRIKYQGNETTLMRTPQEPMLSVEAVLVRGSASISKIFYESQYTQGDDAAPDCWSTNGVTPASDAPKKQSATCASCPKNAWGSKITEAGKKAKACADSRRMAIVPLGDIDNESFGGPMLLRVPPASLGELAAFDAKMRAMGYPLFAIGVRISFDINSEYQKLLYNAIRPLTEEEAQKVLALRESPQVLRILDSADTDLPAASDAPEQVFEQPPPAAAAPAAPAAAAPAAPAAPAAAPAAAAPAAPAAAAPAAPRAPRAPRAPVAAAPATTQAATGFGSFASAPAATPAAPAVPATPPVPSSDDLDSLLDDLLPS